MSFTIEIIIFTILTGIAGSFLANHYSVYALLLVTLFFLALAAAGCVVYGASLSGSAIAALSGVAGLQFGYLLRLFVPRSGRGPGCLRRLKRAQQSSDRKWPLVTRLLGLGLVVPLYVPISQPHSIYPLTALASAQEGRPPGDATGSVVADYGAPSIPTMPFVRLLRGPNPNVSRARLSHLRDRESHAP